MGTVVFQVRANDSDKGRNGRIFYSMVGDNRVSRIFTIDAITGIIYNLIKFDFENLEEFSFNLTVIASDDGTPQKSAITVVQIKVTDDNDSCPTFNRIASEKIEISKITPGDIVTQVSAVDLDSGRNREIKYDISENDAFTVHPKSGIVTVNSTPTRAVYDLTVTAEDNGRPPCKVTTTLTVLIGEFNASETTTLPTEAASSQATPVRTGKSTHTDHETEKPTDTLPETPSSSSVITAPTENSGNFVLQVGYIISKANSHV